MIDLKLNATVAGVFPLKKELLHEDTVDPVSFNGFALPFLRIKTSCLIKHTELREKQLSVKLKSYLTHFLFNIYNILDHWWMCAVLLLDLHHWKIRMECPLDL